MLKRTLLTLTTLAFLMPAGAVAQEPAGPASQPLPIEDLRLFSEVFHQIRTHYVNEVSDKELLEYAIKGMLSGLDPHSAYLDATDFADLEAATTGEFGGLGLEIVMENGFMKVLSPIDDTPAQKAGIRAGDIIMKINNQVIKGQSMDEGVDMLRGEKGSKVTLSILREEEPKPIEITMTRDIIRIKSVKSRILEQQWGYLRISQFQTETGKEAKEHLLKMLDQPKQPLQGLIIDLRNNPGGVLTSAIQISDLFIGKGNIVYTQGRSTESRQYFTATPEALMPDKPIVVLVNSGSASASEIVAGALQDHKRAIIAGTTSFGKGSVQVILELPNQRGMKLTTARYYTPNGRSIQAEGIKPDIVIENASLTLHEDNALQLKEADLNKHLESATSGEDQTAGQETEGDDLKDDYQLHEALNLLKAMSLAQNSAR